MSMYFNLQIQTLTNLFTNILQQGDNLLLL